MFQDLFRKCAGVDEEADDRRNDDEEARLRPPCAAAALDMVLQAQPFRTTPPQRSVGPSPPSIKQSVYDDSVSGCDS